VLCIRLILKIDLHITQRIKIVNISDFAFYSNHNFVLNLSHYPSKQETFDQHFEILILYTYLKFLSFFHIQDDCTNLSWVF